MKNHSVFSQTSGRSLRGASFTFLDRHRFGDFHHPVRAGRPLVPSHADHKVVRPMRHRKTVLPGISLRRGLKLREKIRRRIVRGGEFPHAIGQPKAVSLLVKRHVGHQRPQLIGVWATRLRFLVSIKNHYCWDQ